MNDLWSALCLVAVLEGLFLLVSPGGWKRMAIRMLDMHDQQVRTFGALILLVGLGTLWWLKH